MKSVEVLFNEALAELKAKASPAKYQEVSNKLSTLSTIETKLNCVKDAVTESVKESNPLKLEDLDEAKRDYATLFGVEPKVKPTTTKESTPTIKKNNGAAENFVENSPFNGDRGNATATNNTNKARIATAKSDKVLADGLLKIGSITEAEHRKLVGGKPEGYEKLTERQRKEFDFSRMIGISEADSFTLAKMVGTDIREVSRR